MNKMLKNSLIFFLAFVPLSVLIVPNSFFFPFITGKAFFFRILVEIITGLYLALCVVDPVYRPKKSLLSVCLWIFGGVILVADIFSPNPTRAFWSNFERMEGFVALAHLLLYFLVAGAIYKKKEDWNKFFFVSLGVSVYLIFFGLLQLSDEIVINQGGARVDGTLGNAAYFAIYLVFQIAITLLLWWRNRGNIKGIGEAVLGGSVAFIIYYLYHIGQPGIDAGKFGKIYSLAALLISCFLIWVKYFSQNEKLKAYFSHTLYALVFVLNLSLLYFTATRGAILGLIGGVGLSSLYLIFQKENKNLRKVGASILGAMLLFVAIFLGVKNTEFIKHNPVLSRFASISWSGLKDQARIHVWSMAVDGFKEKPILGWGQEGFNYIFNKYYKPVMWNQEPWFDRAHNSYLDWLVAGGILGFLSYLSIFISVTYLIIKKKEVEVFEKAMLLGLFGAYAFNNIFVFDNLISYIFFFTFLAMVHSESVSHTAEKYKTTDSEGRGALVIFFLVLTIFSIYFINIKGIIQNKTIIKALTLSGVQNDKLLSCVKISYQKNDKGEYGNICMDTKPTIDLFIKSISYFPIGRTEAAEQFLSVSQRINPEPNVSNTIKEEFANAIITEYQKLLTKTPLEAREFLMFGAYLQSIGSIDASIEVLSKARELSPKKQQIIMELSRTYAIKGDYQKAYDLAKEAYDEDVRNTEAKIYYALISLANGNKDQFEKLVGELASAGVADQRIVNALNENFGKNKAPEYLNSVLKTNPDDPTAKSLLESLNK